MLDTLLDYGILGALGLLTGATVQQWVRHRDRTHAYLAWAIGLLAVFLLADELDGILGIDALSDVGLVALLGAGYALLVARHTLSSVPGWMLAATAAALAVTAVAIVGVGVGSGSGSGGVQRIVTFGALGVWGACVGEPAYRFWRLAHRLPVVRAARLRALAVGFGLILLVFLIAVVAPDSPTADATVNWSRFVVLGFLYISFAPPKPLRRIWREHEERNRLESGSLFSGRNRRAQAAAGLEWAARLVGADAGLMASPDGTLLATHGLDDSSAARLLEEVENRRGIVYVGASPARPAIVAPLPLETGRGVIAVIAGPLTPPFSSEEQQLVEHWSNGVAAALDRLHLDELREALLTAVSHEVRTPLTALVGIGETLAHPSAEAIPQEERRRLIDALLRNTKRLEWLLSDIVDVQRLTTGTLQLRRRPTDILALIEETLERFDSLRAHTEITGDGARADVDPAMAVRIVENLLANAGRHTPDGTRIWVRVEGMPGEDGVLLVVEDDGPGIVPALRDFIFEPFRRGPTAPAHSPGAGVGLTLVARLAEAHGGRAWVEERPGGGASFRVVLPRGTQRGTPSRPTTDAPEGGRSQSGRDAASP